MVTLDSGLYFVHSFDLEHIFPAMDTYERRDSRILYPPIFRYQYVRLSEGNIICFNQLGFAILFQRLKNVEDSRAAKQLYDSEAFNYRYEEALNEIRKLTATSVDSSEFSFVLEISSDQLDTKPKDRKTENVQWWFASIPDDYVPQQIFIEAVFIFQLCKSLERSIVNLSMENKSIATERKIFELSKSLLPLQSFFNSEKEINLMKEFFKEWELDQHIDNLKGSFEQSLNNYSLYWTSMDTARQNLMNLLLAAIALLSLAQVTENIHALFPLIREETLNKGLVLAAIVTVLWASCRYLFWDTIILSLQRQRARRLKKNLTSPLRKKHYKTFDAR